MTATLNRLRSQFDYDVARFRATDEYRLRHAAHHLHMAGQRNRLHRLLVCNPAWMTAKSERLIGDEAYLEDLQVALSDYKDPLRPPELLRLAKLRAAQQVVHARVSSYDDQELEVLVWLDRIDDAINRARLRLEALKRFEGLYRIYQALETRNMPDGKLLAELKLVSSGILKEDWQASSLSTLALTQAKAMQLAETQVTVGMIKDDEKKVRALIAIAQTGRQHSQGAQSGTILAEALAVVRARQGGAQKATLLFALAVALAQNSDCQVAEDLLTQAWSLAHNAQSAQRADALDALSRAYARLGRFDLSWDVAMSISVDEEWWRADALSVLVECRSGARDFDDAIEAAKAINDYGWRAKALSTVAVALAGAGHRQWSEQVFDEALQAAEAVHKAWAKAEALCSLAVAISSTDRRLVSVRVFALAECAMTAIQETETLERTQSHVVQALATAGQFDQALAIAKGIENIWSRADAFHVLAKAFAQAGKPAQAVQCFESARQARSIIRRDKEYSGGVSALPRALAECGFFEEAGRVVASIGDGKIRTEALNALAKCGRFTSAGDTVEAIADPWRRGDALVSIADRLAENGQNRQADVYFTEAQAQVARVEGAYGRANAEGNLARALVRADHASRPREVFCQAHRRAMSISERDGRADVLKQLVEALAQAGEYELARRVAADIGPEKKRSEAMGGLVELLVTARRLDLARRVARSIPEPVRRASALANVLVALNGSNHKPASGAILRQIGRALEQITNLSALIEGLIVVASAFDRLGEHEPADAIFQKAHRVVASMDQVCLRAEALRLLAKTDEARVESWSTTASTAALQLVESGLPQSLDTDPIPAVAGEPAEVKAVAENLAAALMQASKFDLVRETASVILHDVWQRSALISSAGTQAAPGRFGEALATLGVRELDAYVETIATWTDGFTHICPGERSHLLYLGFLLSTIGIISWVRSDWRNVYDLVKFEAVEYQLSSLSGPRLIEQEVNYGK